MASKTDLQVAREAHKRVLEATLKEKNDEIEHLRFIVDVREGTIKILQDIVDRYAFEAKKARGYDRTPD